MASNQTNRLPDSYHRELDRVLGPIDQSGAKCGAL
jgi:hypothetical protein